MKDLESFFNPKSIAVIGASNEPEKIGYVILQNLLSSEFKESVFPVNPNHEFIQDRECFASVKKIPGEVELAIVIVPRKFVPKVVRECGEKKAKAVIIITAGFSETGEKKITEQLKKEIQRFPKTRVLGPNCLGIFYSKNRLDTLFLPTYRLDRPRYGGISFISQSGALGSAILDWSAMKEYGVNKFISYGNAMDVDETDLLGFLGEDKETKVIALYLEGVKKGRKFLETAKKISAKKPIIFLKGGVTSGGANATLSHTGSLAGDSAVFKAVAKQASMIQAKSMEEVFDFARVLEKEPKPLGKRIQIITNGGGYGVLTVDAMIGEGLELGEMSRDKREVIAKSNPSHAIIKNPIDLTGDATNLRYRIALEQAVKDPKIDIVVLILLMQIPSLDPEIIEVVREIRNSAHKPLIVISVGGEYTEIHRKALEKAGINTFSSPFNAAKALKALTYYHLKRKK